MTTTADTFGCSLCGRETRTTVLDGVCAVCLLRAGDENIAAEPQSSTPPTGPSHLKRLGDYRIEAEIARGGMGIVYRARQISLNRPVALKLLIGGQLATLESIQRFRIEAEAAAKLEHPGIVPIYQVGEYESQHYLAMKLVDGANLADRLDDFSLAGVTTPATSKVQQVAIARLMSQVARALAYAHRHGVLHRDLKPTNILIDNEAQPSLTDFGLAKLTGHETSGLTLTSAVLGSPCYMSPEQATGQSNDVTTATDIYGLGAVLYELLTGRPPFLGQSALETMRMVAGTEVTRPRRIQSLIHPDLETIALRCLEKRPGDRYSSATALAEELDRFSRGEPILARPVSTPEYLWRWCRRYPLYVGLATAVVIAFLLGFLGVAWQWQRAESVNHSLAATVNHLNWSNADRSVRDGHAPRAVARMAWMMRREPNNWKAAMYAMSVLDNRVFPVPAAPPVSHPEGAELTVARLSPRGDLIATASVDGTARLWFAHTGREATPPLVHNGPVVWAEFSPDGRSLATCSRDNTVHVWDCSTGLPVLVPQTLPQSIDRVHFVRDTNQLVTTSRSTVVLWNWRDEWEEVRKFEHTGPISVAKLGRDGDSLLIAGNQPQSSTSIYSLSSGEKLASLPTGRVTDADLSPDATRLAVADRSPQASIWDVPSATELVTIMSSRSSIDQVKLSADGQRLGAVNHDHVARIWDAETGIALGPHLSHYYMIQGGTFDDSGERFLTWSLDATARVWDTETGLPRSEPLHHADRVHYAEFGTFDGQEAILTVVSHHGAHETGTASAQLWRFSATASPQPRSVGIDPGNLDGVRLSKSGRLIATAKTTREVWVMETETGKVVTGPLPVEGGAWGLMITPDEKRLIATTSRGRIYIWSLPDGELLIEPVHIDTTFQPSTMTDKGDLFATGSTDHFVRIWNSRTAELVSKYQHASELNALDFSPDGRLLASASADHTAIIGNPRTGEIVARLEGHQNEIISLSFAPDSRTVVTTSQDFTARLWDACTGRLLHPPLRHQGEVLDAGFSPDGRMLATSSRDQRVVLWDVKTGQRIGEPLRHQQAVRNVRFSTDGKRLVTCDFTGPRVWDVATGNPLSVHFPHVLQGGTGFQSNTSRPAFTPDDKWLVMGGDTAQALMWPVAVPPDDVPAWFADFLEAVGGMKLSGESETPELVPASRFLRFKRKLLNKQPDNEYERWAQQWLKRTEQAETADFAK